MIFCPKAWGLPVCFLFVFHLSAVFVHQRRARSWPGSPTAPYQRKPDPEGLGGVTGLFAGCLCQLVSPLWDPALLPECQENLCSACRGGGAEDKGTLCQREREGTGGLKALAAFTSPETPTPRSPRPELSVGVDQERKPLNFVQILTDKSLTQLY